MSSREKLTEIQKHRARPRRRAKAESMERRADIRPDLSQIGKPPGQLSLEALADQLRDGGRSKVQRRALATFVGHARGNRYLSQVVAQARGGSTAKRTASIQRQSGASATAKLGGGTHKVRKGDTLWDIAKRYYFHGKYWKDIHALNPGVAKRGGDLIYPGVELKLPQVDVPASKPITETFDPSVGPLTVPKFRFPGVVSADFLISLTGELKFQKVAGKPIPRADGPFAAFFHRVRLRMEKQRLRNRIMKSFAIRKFSETDMTVDCLLGEFSTGHTTQIRPTKKKNKYDVNGKPVTDYRRYNFRFRPREIAVTLNGWRITGTIGLNIDTEWDQKRMNRR